MAEIDVYRNQASRVTRALATVCDFLLDVQQSRGEMTEIEKGIYLFLVEILTAERKFLVDEIERFKREKPDAPNRH